MSAEQVFQHHFLSWTLEFKNNYKFTTSKDCIHVDIPGYDTLLDSIVLYHQSSLAFDPWKIKCQSHQNLEHHQNLIINVPC